MTPLISAHGRPQRTVGTQFLRYLCSDRVRIISGVARASASPNCSFEGHNRSLRRLGASILLLAGPAAAQAPAEVQSSPIHIQHCYNDLRALDLKPEKALTTAQNLWLQHTSREKYERACGAMTATDAHQPLASATAFQLLPLPGFTRVAMLQSIGAEGQPEDGTQLQTRSGLSCTSASSVDGPAHLSWLVCDADIPTDGGPLDLVIQEAAR